MNDVARTYWFEQPRENYYGAELSERGGQARAGGELRRAGEEGEGRVGGVGLSEFDSDRVP